MTAAAGATGLRGMVPATFGGKTLQTDDPRRRAVTFTRETIKGVEYAFFAAANGAYTASYGADTSAPAITARAVTPAANGTATITWTTDEASDSRVDYGTSAASLTLNRTDGARVTAHSLQLTGLTPGTTYHYRVRSADAAGNATTQPAAPAAPATFRIPLTVTARRRPRRSTRGRCGRGAASALTADDNVYYQVNSTTSGTRTTSSTARSRASRPPSAR